MNLEDVLLPPRKMKTEKWQLGSMISEDFENCGIALIFCSDYRGTKDGEAEILDFRGVRGELYKLSKLDFEIPVCDLGDLISGKTHADTHYILQEVLTACFDRNVLPVVIGGSNDLSFSLFAALNFKHKNLTYSQISNIVSLAENTEEITERNFLTKILSDSNFSLKDYHHLGYQKHLNEVDSVKLMKEVNFDVIRLAEMMHSTENTEPYFRRADLVTVNCDAVESSLEEFSINPQINGLNRREICAYMKEVGLSDNLKAAGIFNYNAHSETLMNQQLLAQMIWHLIEGINIQKTHPKEREYDTFFVMIDNAEVTFQRDSFTGLWFFGAGEDRAQLIPCSRQDYEDAKRGNLSPRFLRSK